MRRELVTERSISRWFVPVAALLLAVSFGVAADTDNTETSPSSTAAVSEDLIGFFAQIEGFAPSTGISGAAGPELLADLADGFNALDPETRQKMNAAGSRWKHLIEATAATLPQASTAQYRSFSRQALAAVDASAEQTRRTRFALALLSILNEAELAKMGVDKESVLALAETLAVAELPQANLLVQRLDADGSLRMHAAKTLALLPPDARAAVERLAMRGRLSEQDKAEVAVFRSRYTEMLQLAAAAPPETVARFGFEVSRESLDLVASFSDEALWLMSKSRDLLGLEDMVAGLRIIVRGEAVDVDSLKGLEEFRQSALGWAGHPAVREVLAEESAAVYDLLDQAGAGELFLLRARFEQMSGWQVLPHLADTTNSPEYTAEIAALEAGTMAPERRDEIESFRGRMLDALSELPGDPSDDLRERISSASLADLVGWEQTSARIGQESERVLVQSLRAEIQNPPRRRDDTKGNCGVSIPCYLDHLRSSVVNGVRSVFNSTFDVLKTAAAYAETKVKEITAAAKNTFAQIPSQALGLIERTYEGILAKIRESGVFDPSRIAEAMGVVEGFWENLPEAPEIPCPEIGVAIPGYGIVGQSETAARYAQSSWVVEKALDLVPDDELALKIKIPLKSFWGGVQYLGKCLDNAAAAVADAETAAYREEIRGAVATTNEELSDLDAQIVVIHNELIDVSRRFDRLTIENQRLALRFAIESNLLERKGDRVGRFQLPEMYGGVLETVQEIVQESIDRVMEAGLNTNGAEAIVARAFEQYQAGQYAEAFESYRAAYRRVVYQREVGNGNIIKP